MIRKFLIVIIALLFGLVVGSLLVSKSHGLKGYSPWKLLSSSLAARKNPAINIIDYTKEKRNKSGAEEILDYAFLMTQWDFWGHLSDSDVYVLKDISRAYKEIGSAKKASQVEKVMKLMEKLADSERFSPGGYVSSERKYWLRIAALVDK